MTSAIGILTRNSMLRLGILSGIAALGTLAWTWERELSTGEIAWVLGSFSMAVSLVFLAINRRGDNLQNQFQ